MKKRNIALAIIFSIITLGIYSLFWFVRLTNETNALAKTKTANGIAALLFTIITLGIYSIYWTYMLGVKSGEISETGSRGGLFLVFYFFGLGFLVPILAQKTLNAAIQKKTEITEE